MLYRYSRRQGCIHGETGQTTTAAAVYCVAEFCYDLDRIQDRLYAVLQLLHRLFFFFINSSFRVASSFLDVYLIILIITQKYIIYAAVLIGLRGGLIDLCGIPQSVD